VLVALLEDGVPHTVELRLTRVLRVLAVNTLLLAASGSVDGRDRAVANPNTHGVGITLLNHVVGDTDTVLGLSHVNTVALAARGFGSDIPHTP
jgi:hypothetical protein